MVTAECLPMTAAPTRDEILALPAGKVLDALVADRIFGRVACDKWHPVNFGSAGGPALMRDDDCPHDEGKCYPSMSVNSAFGPVGGPPRYSTDIAAAWLVVEKLKADAWEPMVIGGETYDEWSVQIAVGNPINGPTAPLAVCRAALIAAVEDDSYKRPAE